MSTMVQSQGFGSGKAILGDIDLRWLATAAARHVYSIWRDRDRLNKQVNSKMVSPSSDPLQFSTTSRKYNLLGIVDKNRLIDETSIVIDQLTKDDHFEINIPKQMQQWMF